MNPGDRVTAVRPNGQLREWWVGAHVDCVWRNTVRLFRYTRKGKRSVRVVRHEEVSVKPKPISDSKPPSVYLDSETPFKDAWLSAAFDLANERGINHVCLVALKGSRLFRQNEPGADVDLRLMWLAPTERMLGLRRPKDTEEYLAKKDESYADRNCHDGPDRTLIDFVAYESEKFMRLLLADNGNMIESLCVPEGFFWADEHGLSLRRIANRFITRRLYKFYRGYAFTQFGRGTKVARSGKNLIACYRELFMGLKVLTTGEHEFEWTRLVSYAEEHLGGWTSKVLPRAIYDRAPVTDGLLQQANEEFAFLDDALIKAVETSSLPDRYDGLETLDRLLCNWRSEGWV